MGDLLEKSQKQWMKNLWISYKQHNIPESLWSRVSEMVSFYNSDVTPLKEDGSVPVGTDCTLSPVGPREISPQEPPVKRLVCSPDLPVFEERPSSSSPEKLYQCTFCNKTFPQKNTYQNHLRSHSKDGEDPYQCNICGKTFAVPARLTRHYRTHTGEKPYQCEYCNKSFSVKENLSVHRRIHTKERPYKCEVCERAFEHSGKLHRHMRIHTGERPHKCTVCSKTFIQSGQLVIHTRTHTGEKPYVCKVCGKGFTCSKQLKVHTRTHTGEKPYSCDICGKSFGYNHVLKLHQVSHYGEKVYKCTICSETFTSKKTMELHIKSHSEQSSNNNIPTTTNTTTTVPTRTVTQGTDMGESCASSTSDKENKESDCEVRATFDVHDKEMHPHMEIMMESPTVDNQPTLEEQKHPNMRELCYYLYYPKVDKSYKDKVPQSGGVNPALLAAAAAAANEDNLKIDMSPEDSRLYQQYIETATNYPDSPVPLVEPSSAPVEPSVYLCPNPLASMQRRNTFQIQLTSDYLSDPDPMELRQHSEEKQSLSPVLTPPSSNPVSPAPSSSPDPVDLVTNPRETLSLPPRKRSKMILKSLETETSRLRQSSVIQFARASSMKNT